MPKIRILFTIPNFDTAGSGKVVYDLAKNLDKDLFEVEIACNHNKGDFFKVVESLGLKIHLFTTTTNYRPFPTLPFRAYRISRFFKKNRFDIIHSWHWNSDWTEPLAARIAGVKWVYTKKAMSWGSPGNWKLRSRLASYITILNPDMKDQYFKRYKNVRLLPLGLDTNYYASLEKQFSIDGVSFTQNDFVVITVVNLTKAKGIEVLVDAIRLLDDRDMKLLIIGDYNSEYGNFVYNKVQQEGLADRIKFAGKVLDVRKYLSLADVFVISTNVNWEGMPMAPVEAMSSARVVIGTNTTGINYILHGFEDFLAPPGDAAALANKIATVKSMSPTERKVTAEKMRDKVCNEYSMQQFCKGYEQLYTELCDDDTY